MSDKNFLDSNVIVYAHTDLDLQKQQVAQHLMAEHETVISTQVLQETANILSKKFQFGWPEIQTVLNEVATNNHLHINSAATVQDACRVASRYGYSFYDSLIVSAALESGCATLCSEDLQNGQVIDNVLTIRNPF